MQSGWRSPVHWWLSRVAGCGLEKFMLDVLPKIRDEIDAFPYNGSYDSADFGDLPVYILYDTSGLSEAQLLIAESSMSLISRLDGKHSIIDLRAEYERDTGTEIELADIEGLVLELDNARFLDNHRFKDLYNNLLSEFITGSVRSSVCAGSVYSADITKLQLELESLLVHAPKPEVQGRAGNVMRRAPRGIIAPHMDFKRAAFCYGQIYKEMREHYNRPDAVIILGTAHGPLQQRFAVCDKDFAVTGGVVRCQREITSRILADTSAVADFTEDVFAHRSEHSIELQAVWLDYIWKGIEIVPILVGGMDNFLENPALAAIDPEINIMVNALRNIMNDYRVTVIASADLSHIGRRFGDSRDLDIGFISETEVADREYLRAVLAGDGQKALELLASNNDRYHICGIGCIYLLGALLPGINGQLLGYYQAVSHELEQAVGCAGAIFE